jgi:pyridoxal phosphate enzyme (YggS family)
MSDPASQAVQTSLLEVRKRIEAAESAAGREPGSTRLIAVSKRQPAEKIRAAYEAGQRDFGENYVKELVEKAEQLRDLPELVWHMVGHLQTNKARQIAGLVGCVHTVSSVKLTRELGKRVAQGRVGASQLGRLPVLVEVNVGGEANKSGCAPQDMGEILRAISEEKSLVARGLMTVPPVTVSPEGAAPYFAQLRGLRESHGGAGLLPELSMGMSADLEQAVGAGATWVRIGTAIFGARPTLAG